jgi:plasmid stabilization system protein ParE
MTERIRFFLEASEEIEDASNWYGRRSPAAQAAFLREVDDAIAAIVDAPQRWTVYVDGTRRYIFRKFPYSVVYFVDEGLVLIVAVAHDKRRPGYWRGRLS